MDHRPKCQKLIIIMPLEENIGKYLQEVETGKKKKKLFFTWTQKAFTTEEKANKLDYSK